MKKLIRPITSAARPNSYIEQNIYFHQQVGIEHLAKLYLYADIRTYDIQGWKRSVWESLSGVPKSATGKYKNKYPSADMIYKWSWGGVSDSIEDQFPTWVEYFTQLDPPYPKPEGKSAAEFAQKVEQYYFRVAQAIETSGVGTISFQAASNILEDIFDI